MAGLVVFLSALNRVLADVVACIGGFLFGAYMITNVLPIFAIGCPYRTPLSSLIYPLYDPGSALIRLFVKITVFVMIIPFIFVRNALGCVGLLGKKKNWLPSVVFHLPSRMGKSLREAEHAHVEHEEKVWTHAALSWLASTTSDPSAKVILVETLGPTDAPLDGDPLLPVFTQQWSNTGSRLIAGEPSNLSDEMSLGRLIRSTISQAVTNHSFEHEPITTMLNNLPNIPITAFRPPHRHRSARS
jgi:hypothetical protein